MRDDYKETGRREGDDYEEFPFCQKCPILVIGILKGNKGVFKSTAQSNNQLRNAHEEVKEKCKRGSIEMIGAWPGKWSTDLFELNVKYMMESVKK